MSDIAAWLENLGLGKYQEVFAENDIDIDVLVELNDVDLKELGVSLGDRKRLLKAIAAEDAPSASAPEAAAGTAAAPAAQPAPATAAERRQLTVMFVDLVGSTALSGQLDPEDLRELILGYQNVVAGEISRFEGYVARYMGDGILVYFGWPRAHEDDAERAVHTALAVTAAVAKLRTPTNEALATRTGIATGLVVVGDLIGEGAAQEQTVVGETPNLAARLQGLAEPDAVVISDVTRRLLGEVFELQALGPQTLKGIAEPVPVYRVVGERSLESRFDAHHEGASLTVVGRDEELALALQRWQQVKGGEGQMILLTGEAGIGKSGLLGAVGDALKGQPYYRINDQCSPYHTDSALYPVIQQLTRAADLATGDDNETKLDKLEALLGLALAEPTERAPLIAALLGIDSEARYGTLDLTPLQQRTQTLQALVAQLTGLAQRQPVLFVLEDAHWIDPSTLELIELALAAISQSRILLFITARPTFEHHFGGHPLVTRIMLNRLGREPVVAIIHRLTAGKTIPDELLDEIVRKTDGVPLFVEELTKTVLESGLLRETDAAYVLDGPLESLDIPSSLHDSLMARLDRLQPVKAVAQTAACIGREFSHALLAGVAGHGDERLQAALEQLIEAELMFRRGLPPDAVYTFKHALVRDAAYESLLKSKRQQIHARIGQTLEEHFTQMVAAEPELVAYHYSEAQLAEQAVPYWRRAGQQALERSANVEAIEHLNKGLALLEAMPDTPERARQELPLQITLGPALMAVKGQGAPEIGRSYARALELGPQVGDTGQHFRALWGSWRYHFMRADYPPARSLGEQCVALAEKAQDDAVMLEACFALGGSLAFMGDFPAARSLIERAIPLYNRDKHHALKFEYGQDPGASNLAYLGWILVPLGYPKRALESAHQALTLAETLKHPFTQAQVHMYLVMTLAFCRDWPAARSSAEAAIAFSKKHGFPQPLWLSSIIHGRALIDVDRLEAGIAQLEKGLAAREASGIEVGKLFTRTFLAEAYAVAKRNNEALQVLAEALDFAHRTGEGFYLPEIHRLKGNLLLQQDSASAAEDALVCFRQGLDTARRQQAKSLELRSATSLARVWHAQDRRQEAYDLLAPVYDWFTEGFDMADLKDAKALLDELA